MKAGITLITTITVLLMVSVSSMVLLQSRAFVPGLKSNLSPDPSRGSVNQFAINTSFATASDYIIPSATGASDPTNRENICISVNVHPYVLCPPIVQFSHQADPKTISASVTSYGSSGSHEIAVTNDNGVTPASIVHETGKLNQMFR